MPLANETGSAATPVKTKKPLPTTSTPAPTTSYGDDHRSPTPIVPSTTTTPSTSSSGGIGSLLKPSTSGTSTTKPKKKAPSVTQPSGTSIIDGIVNKAKEAIAVQEKASDKKWAELFNPGTAPVDGANQSEPAKPRKTYLQRHPLVQQQVNVALQGNPDDAIGVLGNLLSEKFSDDNTRLYARMQRKQNAVDNYYSDAQIAIKKGDLDYTEDNPINPKWTKTPNVATPDDQRKAMMEAIKANPEQEADITEFFMGTGDLKYSGLGGGLIGQAVKQQKPISFFQQDLQRQQDYYKIAYKKAKANEETYNNWTAADEAKQDAEAAAKESAKAGGETRNTATVDDDGNLVGGMTSKERRHEIKQRLKSGRLDPDDLLSLLGSSDVLTGPDVKYTAAQQKQVDAAMDAKAQDEQKSDIVKSVLFPGVNSSDYDGNSGWDKLARGIDGAISHITQPSSNSLYWAMDKLTRPLYGVNAMRKTIYNMNKDTGDENANESGFAKFMKLATAGEGLTSGGASSWDSLDEISEHPWDATKKIAGSGWHGLTSGGWGESKDGDLGASIIKYNAARDGVKNIYDNNWYQAIAGFGSDVVFDPTTYIGGVVVKPVTKSLDVAKAANETRRLAPVAEDISKFVKGTEIGEGADAKTIHDLLSGGGYRKVAPATKKQVADRANRIIEGRKQVHSLINEARDEHILNKADDLAEYNKLADSYKDRIATVQRDYDRAVLHADPDVKDLVNDPEVADMIRTKEIANKLPAIHAGFDFSDAVATATMEELHIPFKSDYRGATAPLRQHIAKLKTAAAGEGVAAKDAAAQLAKVQSVRSAHEARLADEGMPRGEAVSDVIGGDHHPVRAENAFRSSRKWYSSTNNEQARTISSLTDAQERAVARGKASKDSKVIRQSRDDYEKLGKRIQRIANQQRLAEAESALKITNAPQSARYQALQDLKTEAREKLETADNESFTGLKFDERVDYSEAERPTEYLDKDNKYDSIKVFEPDPAFGSYEAQLRHIIRTAEAGQRSLSKNLEGQAMHLDTVDLVKSMPDAFRTADGGFNSDLLFTNGTGNTDKGFIVWNQSIRRFERSTLDTGDVAADKWLDRVVTALDDMQQKVYDKVRGEFKGVGDTAADQSRKAWIAHLKGSETHQQVMDKVQAGEMFVRSADRGTDNWLPRVSGDGVHPAIQDPDTGKILLLGTNKKRWLELATKHDIARSEDLSSTLKSVIDDTSAGIDRPPRTVRDKAFEATKSEMAEKGYATRYKHFENEGHAVFTKGDKKITVTVDEAIKKHFPDTTLEKRVERIAPVLDHLRAVGWNLPEDNTAAFRHLVAKRQSVSIELTPEAITQYRMFERANGMSVAEARTFRERALGKIVGDDFPEGSQWAKLHPGGITESEFVAKGLRDADSFGELFRGGPFRDKSVQRMSEKEARDSGAGEKWIRNQYAHFNKLDEVEQVRWLRRMWRGQWESKLARNKAAEKTFRDNFEQMNTAIPDKIKDYNAIAAKTATTMRETFADRMRLGQMTVPSHEYEIPRHIKSSEVISAARENVADKAKQAADEVKAEIADPATLKTRREELESVLKHIEYDAMKADRLLDVTAKRMERQSAELKARLDEETILRAASANKADAGRVLALRQFGVEHVIPGSEAMFRAVDKISGFALIKGARKNWSDAFNGFFRSPGKRLNDADMYMIRSMQTNMVPNIIEHSAKQLAKNFGKFELKEREHIMMYLHNGDIKGAKSYNPELWDAIQDSISGVLYHINKKIGDRTYNLSDLNRRLPTGLNLTRIPNDAADLISNMVEFADRAKVKGNRRLRKFKQTISDPYALAWHLHIADQTAMGDLALYDTINKTFGVARGPVRIGKNARNAPSMSSGDRLIEQLQSKHGWKELDFLPEEHRTYLFPEDTYNGIKVMYDMFDPRKVSENGQKIQDMVNILIDKPTTGWKGVTTLYNPGYYTRNGVGEIMSSWLDGVNRPSVYLKAHKVMKWANKSDAGMDSVIDKISKVHNLDIGDKVPKGTDTVFTMASGEKVTYERLFGAYNSQGLKTGFFNTEFEGGQAGFKTHENPVAKAASAVHGKVREFGEVYEDKLRLAHFIDVIEKSTKPFDEAALEAAGRVRKFHFDYTDFSPFEKAVMMRVFPFYKWTRKAMPMMTTQLFMNPGKMVAYPKAMNAISNGLSNQDVAEDPNGYLPNYTGLAPNWVMDLWAYQVSEEHGDNGENTAFRMATPQLDALTAVTNLDNTGQTLLSPLLKTGINQIRGKSSGTSLGPDDGENNLDSGMDRFRDLLQQTPQGSYIAKTLGQNSGGYDNSLSTRDNMGPVSDNAFLSKLLGNDTLSFATGLGFYDSYNDPGKQTSSNNQDSLTPEDNKTSVAPVGVADLQGLFDAVRRRQ